MQSCVHVMRPQLTLCEDSNGINARSASVHALLLPADRWLATLPSDTISRVQQTAWARRAARGLTGSTGPDGQHGEWRAARGLTGSIGRDGQHWTWLAARGLTASTGLVSDARFLKFKILAQDLILMVIIIIIIVIIMVIFIETRFTHYNLKNNSRWLGNNQWDNNLLTFSYLHQLFTEGNN